jgi:hypothetical protein
MYVHEGITIAAHLAQTTSTSTEPAEQLNKRKSINVPSKTVSILYEIP